jgi:hypothetical protein
MFLVYGNIRDLQPWTDADGVVEWVPLQVFLQRFLARTRDVIAYYNVSQGLQCADRGQEKRLRLVVDTQRALRGDSEMRDMPRAPLAAIAAIEDLITSNAQSSGVVVDYFEMIAPQGDVSFMTTDDRACLVSMMRWSSDPAFLSTDNLVILLTEHLSDVSRRILASPQLVTLQVPFPDEPLRGRFIDDQAEPEVLVGFGTDAFAQHTAGLSLLQIRSILRSASQTGKAIDFRAVTRRKKTIIEQECHGLVEFVDPGHDFRHVGGLERIKADLMRVADAVKGGHVNRVPMGMIFVGPMGTGKTYVAEAFAAESGLTCLKFKNFRDKWVGSTEGNLEKVLDLVEALGYVLLIIDEADRSLSSGDNDGGTSSRVIARLKEFLSDTSHRGRVVVLMMTNRPDKLDSDLKRPGRFDFKIPFFFPEAASERRLILEALGRKNDVKLVEGTTYQSAADCTQGYSSAEMEAVLIAATNLCAEGEREEVSQEDLDRASADVVPSRDKRMLEYMEMLAVFECSARRMLPEQYREMETTEVLERLDRLRSQLGRRAM